MIPLQALAIDVFLVLNIFERMRKVGKNKIWVSSIFFLI